MTLTAHDASVEAREARGYPPAPWRLYGPGAVVAMPVPLAAARRLVPGDLQIVQIAPGWTVGGILLARYGPEATLSYDELIVFCGLARGAGRAAFWVSHIYVDLEASVAGGREIWGLPKETAECSWEPGGSVSVTQAGRPLLSARLPQRGRRAPLPVVAPVWGTGERELLHTVGKGWIRGSLGPADVDVPAASPLAAVELGSPRICVAGTVDLPFPAPARVGAASAGPEQR